MVRRRHGAGLRKIAGRATPPPLRDCLHLSIYSMYYISLHCTLYILRISSCTFIALSPPCTMLSVRGADCRKIARSRPDAWPGQSLPIHHLTSYCMRTPCNKIFHCIQFEIITQQEMC